MLGSMRALPNVVRLIAQAGANLTHFRVNTPICCPSRSTMLTEIKRLFLRYFSMECEHLSRQVRCEEH